MDDLKKKEIGIIVISLAILVVGFFVLQQLGVVTVGQATFSGQIPDGFYWASGDAPKTTKDFSGSEKTGDDKKCADVGGFWENGVCCEETYMCSEKGGLDKSKTYCYYTDSIYQLETKKNVDNKDVITLSSHLCTQGDKVGEFISCIKEEIRKEDDAFLCDGKSLWHACDSNTHANEIKEGTSGNEYFCDGSSWLDCKGAGDKDNLICVKDINNKDNILLCDGSKGSKNKLAPGSNANYCDGTEYIQCTDEKKLDMLEQGNYICDGTDWKLCSSSSSEVLDTHVVALCPDASKKWELCDSSNKFTLRDNKKYYCDGTYWDKCASNKGRNGKALSKDKLTCVGNSWSLNLEESNEYLAISKIDDYVVAKKKDGSAENVKISTYFSKAGSDVGNAVDLANNLAFYNTLAPGDSNDKFFMYKKIFYSLSLSSDGKTSSTLTVSSLSDNKELKKQTFTLAKDETFFTPAPIAIDLDGDLKNDVFFHLLRGSPLVTSEILFALSPRLDFDSKAEAVAIVTSQGIQEFNLQGEHKLNLFAQGKNYVVFFDNAQYQATKTGKLASSGTHYFDEFKKVKLGFTVLESEGLFSLIYLKRNAATVAVSIVPQKEVKLADDYEGTFDNKVVLNIKDGGSSIATNTVGTVGVIGVCEDDPKVLTVLSVCDESAALFNLQNSVPRAYDNQLFLFKSPSAAEAKKGTAYRIIDISKAEVDQLATVFANNLADGKTVALKVADKEYYLLTQDKANFLDLTKLKMQRLTEGQVQNFLPEGDQNEVVFNLPLGKQINVRLDASKASLKYFLSSKIVSKDTANLLTDLTTQVSTYSKLKIEGIAVGKDLGEVKLDLKDTTLLENTMRVVYGKDSKSVQLVKGEVTKDNIVEDTLFYYNKFTVSSKSGEPNTYTKYADVYLYRDLTSATFEHKLSNNDFILPLTKGNKIAFGLDETYYLLSYADKWDGKSATGFNLNKLQLTAVNGTNAVSSKVVGDEFFFDFGVNRIIVSLYDAKDGQKMIKFEGFNKKAVTKEKEDAATKAADKAKEAATTKVVFKASNEMNFSQDLVPGTDTAPTSLTIGKKTYKL